MIKDDELIEIFINILNNKNDPQHRDAKVALAIWKENTAAWLKEEVLSQAALKEMMEDEAAYQTAMQSLQTTKGQSPNITSGEGVGIYAQAGGHGTSPVKQMPDGQQEPLHMYEDIDIGDGETIRVMNMLPQEYYRQAPLR